MRSALTLTAILTCAAGCADLEIVVDPVPEQIAEPAVELAVGLRARDPEGAALRFDLVTEGTTARVETVSPSTALFLWTPQVSDLGQHDFLVRVGDAIRGRTFPLRVLVRFGNGGAAPRFVSPAGVGTTFDPVRERCLAVPVVVSDPDSLRVRVLVEPPSPPDAALRQEGPFALRLSWCPVLADIGRGGLVSFVFAAYDGVHPPTIKSYLVLVRPWP